MIAKPKSNGQVEITKQFGCTIVLKGGPTVVIGSDQTWTNGTGNPGMASAGSGDVLTGVITSLLGQGLCAWDAARLGVWLHGKAGDLAAETSRSNQHDMRRNSGCDGQSNQIDLRIHLPRAAGRSAERRFLSEPTALAAGLSNRRCDPTLARRAHIYETSTTLFATRRR